MTTAQQPIHLDQTVAELATTRPGASRVFHRHGLDFCCGGHVSLREASAKKGLDVDALIAELEREAKTPGRFERWDERPIPEALDRILEAFHEPHRRELPRLLEMAQKVERVHADKKACPHGLAKHLEEMIGELESHMEKEEQVLFPMLRAGRGRMAAMPIQVMEEEHRDHGRNLERMRVMTDNYTPPAEACNTWRALYLGLAEFESEIMEHIHIENNIVFPRALRG